MEINNEKNYVILDERIIINAKHAVAEAEKAFDSIKGVVFIGAKESFSLNYRFKAMKIMVKQMKKMVKGYYKGNKYGLVELDQVDQVKQRIKAIEATVDIIHSIVQDCFEKKTTNN